MIKKIEGYLFGKVAGRVIARLAVSVAAYIVAQAASAGVNVNSEELSAALIAGANAAYSMVKEWRDKRAAKGVPTSDPAADKPL